MLFHEVSDPWVSLDLPSGFHGLPPGEVFSLRGGSSSPLPSRISLVFGQVASLFVADEALAVSHVLHSLTGREIDFIYIHCVWVRASDSLSWWDVAVSSSSGFLKSYHVSVEFSCFVKPLFPFPASLFLAVREGSGSHHDGELLGYSSLEGIHKDAVIIDSTARLGQLECSGVLIEVSIKLVHTEGIDGLSGSIFDILRDEGFFKSLA